MSVQKPVKTSLPALPASAAPDMRMYLERVREELSRIQAGSSSTTIINNSSGSSSGTGTGTGGGGGGVDPTTLPCGAPVTPTAPTNFLVTAGFNFFMVEWDYPSYCGHSHTEIYGTKDDGAQGTEVLLGTTGGTLFTVAEPNNGVRRCFWAKHVNLVGVKGPYNSTEGTCDTTALDPGYLIEVLTGQITKTQLYKDLGEKIDQIPLLESGFIDERINRETADGVLTQEVTQVAAVADGAAAGVTDITTARIGYCTKNGETTANGDKATCEANGGVWNLGLPWATAVKQVSVTYNGQTVSLQQQFDAVYGPGGLRAQYSVKIDNNGLVSGFGLASEPVTGGGSLSSFGVRADRFWIAAPTDTSKPNAPAASIPFIVTTTPYTDADGNLIPVGVYITEAFIKAATITTAKIKNAAITNAKILSLSAGKLTAGSIAIGECIGSAAIAPDTLPMWQICGNGSALFRNITIKDTAGQILLSSGTGISVPGTNLVPNSALGSSDEEPWVATKPLTTGSLTVSVNPGWPTRPPGVNAIGLVKSGTTGDPVLLSSGPFAVLAGSRYEAFGNVAVLNCDASLRVYWYNNDDAYLGYANLTPATLPRQTGALTDLANWPRAEGFVVAPSGAVSARLKVYSDALDAGTTQGNVVLARPYMGSALPTQSAFSTWSPTYFAPIGPGNRTTYIRDATIDNAAIKNLSAGKLLAGNIAASEYISIGEDVTPTSGSQSVRNAGLYLDGPSRCLWVRSGTGSARQTRVRLGYIRTLSNGTALYGLHVLDATGKIVIATSGTEELGAPYPGTSDCYINSAYIKNLTTGSINNRAITGTVQNNGSLGNTSAYYSLTTNAAAAATVSYTIAGLPDNEYAECFVVGTVTIYPQAVDGRTYNADVRANGVTLTGASSAVYAANRTAQCLAFTGKATLTNGTHTFVTAVKLLSGAAIPVVVSGQIMVMVAKR